MSRVEPSKWSDSESSVLFNSITLEVGGLIIVQEAHCNAKHLSMLRKQALLMFCVLYACLPINLNVLDGIRVLFIFEF